MNNRLRNIDQKFRANTPLNNSDIASLSLPPELR
jgi:hypothetical protein